MCSISAFNSFVNSITTSIQTIAKRGWEEGRGGSLGVESNLHHTLLTWLMCWDCGPARRVGWAAGRQDGQQVFPVMATRLNQASQKMWRRGLPLLCKCSYLWPPEFSKSWGKWVSNWEWACLIGMVMLYCSVLSHWWDMMEKKHSYQASASLLSPLEEPPNNDASLLLSEETWGELLFN